MWVGCLHPNFYGCAIRVERRTDYGDFAIDWIVQARNSDGSFIAYLQQRSFGLRDVSSRDDLRNVHHGDQRSSSSRHFSRIERAIGDHTINRAPNFGVI